MTEPTIAPPESTPPPETPAGSAAKTALAGKVAAGASCALALLWLLDIGAGVRVPWPARGIALIALAALAIWGASWLAGKARRRDWLVPALLALSLAVRLSGVAHEVSGRYYGDEGTYYRHAQQIDAGHLLTRSFVYPHLTYYLDAFALWLAEVFHPVSVGLAHALLGIVEPLEREWLVLRVVAALLGAFAVVPVVLLARRIASPSSRDRSAAAGASATAAGALAGLLLIANPHFNMGSHLFICDVPSAFFAAVSLAFAGRLLDRERTRDYVYAGLWAGLAAAAKYPAGLVAIAIVALYVRWRIRRKDLRLGLLWAGLVALAAFVAAMPSLFAYPEIAFFGQRGMLFGARQYAFHGWIGVIPDSNAVFYLNLMAESFGGATLALGLAGFFALDSGRRRRWLWMAVFPVTFLALLLDMAMVVKRNLYPAMPPLAALLGVGLAALAERLARPLPKLRPFAAPLLAALCLAVPGWRTAIETIGLARKTTRDLAVAWMRDNLPPGARIVKEQYAPNLPEGAFEIVPTRFAARLGLDQIRAEGNDYLLLASDAFRRFLNPDVARLEHHKQIGARYRTILDTFPKIGQWDPTATRIGPVVLLYRLEPLPRDCREGGSIPATEAHVPDGRMRDGGEIVYGLPGQWSLWKGCFAGGRYRFSVDGAPSGPGAVRLVDAANRELARVPLSGSPAAVALPRRAKYFFYLDLPAGSRIRGVAIAAIERASPV
ncbi:MAG TPA: glycosyltransferase family 39 protein [Thermoanaerobaculia bacterium]|nr:glycosyltransferase family 39 protein [Thermoanaerobaculia bacterium]